MHCDKCGKEMKGDIAFCTHCGNRSDNPKQNAKGVVEQRTKLLTIKTYRRHVIIGLIVFCFIGYFWCIRCKAGLCILPGGFQREYCEAHTCERSGCKNKKQQMGIIVILILLYFPPVLPIPRKLQKMPLDFPI